MAEKATFTPGPWHASRKSNFINSLNNVPLATVGRQPAREADAILMAASPELLAALEEMTAIYRDNIPGKAEPRCIQRALAAIAKATIPGANDVR